MTVTALRHHCHAIGCSKACPPQHLMCLAHWSMVPEPIKRQVWEHFRRGQERDKSCSKEWREAAAAAINAVRSKELKKQGIHDRRGNLFIGITGNKNSGNQTSKVGRG